MSDKFFVDSAVLVYARDVSEPEKQKKAVLWMTYLWASQKGRISYQVLWEYYTLVTEKLKPGMDRENARNDIRALLVWNPIPIQKDVIEGAWFVQDRFGLVWSDALIVSAAQVAGCRYLLSHHFDEKQMFGNVKVVNPFLNSPYTGDFQKDTVKV